MFAHDAYNIIISNFLWCLFCFRLSNLNEVISPIPYYKVMLNKSVNHVIFRKKIRGFPRGF